MVFFWDRRETSRWNVIGLKEAGWVAKLVSASASASARL